MLFRSGRPGPLDGAGPNTAAVLYLIPHFENAFMFDPMFTLFSSEDIAQIISS